MCSIEFWEFDSSEFQCSSASRKFLNRAGRVASPRSLLFQCSSASRKFLNGGVRVLTGSASSRQFQCSSASRKFLNPGKLLYRGCLTEFQCSSASRKFLNLAAMWTPWRTRRVSVLFSEPKIPQSVCGSYIRLELQRFSALQRAENSSIDDRLFISEHLERFQCSSASRKFLNLGCLRARSRSGNVFQCSSASRKFLNTCYESRLNVNSGKFQCSSASRKFLNCCTWLMRGVVVEFQCSSASRKFLNGSCLEVREGRYGVSVLFSEPKIPQSQAV